MCDGHAHKEGSAMNVQSILGAKGSDVATVGRQASLAEAANLLRERGIGALVVSDDSRHIDGIISERDVVRALAAHGAGALSRTVASVMTADVVTCRHDDSVERLMHLMTDRRIRHLPVTDDDDLMTGIISIGDVVKGRLGQLEVENQALHDYITQGR
jgi:CBS domain-containing protein